MQIEKETHAVLSEKNIPKKRPKVKYHPFEYAVVIKAHEGYMTFSIPDFHYFKAVDLPKGQLTPQYLQLVAKNIGQCWLKTQENLARLNEYESKPPSPALIKDLLKKRKYKRLGVNAVSALLQKSKQTVRRMADSGEIKCKKDVYGRRSFKESDVLKFIES